MSAPDSILGAGTVLVDRYRLGQRIAVGGMGEVWEAADTRLDRRVAVKVLRPELSGDPELRHRFRTEARTAASLNHPSVAAVHDYGETADSQRCVSYLVMELVPGGPLAAMLARRGRLPAAETLEMLEQAGAALQAAHERGLVHRDVKPGNILVTPTGRVKLTDFGIAKAVDAAPVTRAGMVMGTAHYMAPEQARGAEAGPAADVYSLAVMGYECLAGRRPFPAEDAVAVAMAHIRDAPPALPSDVPSGARRLIEAALVKNPRRRYGSGGEFAAAAAAVRAGLPVPIPAGPLRTDRPLIGRPRPGLSRRATWTPVALLAGALVLGGYALHQLRTGPAPAAGGGPPLPVAATFEEDPRDFVGRAADRAVDRLGRDGLVGIVRTGTGAVPADPHRCQVVGLSPTGDLHCGQAVTLTCREQR